MSRLVDTRATRLERRDEPLGAVARNVAANLYAIACARIFLARCSHVGRGARSFGWAYVDNRGHIFLGDDFATGAAHGRTSFVAARGAHITIGDAVVINHGTSLRAARGITVGSRTLIGPHCTIEDADSPDGSDAAEIVIGAGVWLAAHVVVRPGATIGSGAVISAGSVVEGKIPAHAVASGAPARVLRIRKPVIEADRARVA